MDYEKLVRKAKPKEINSKSNREFILIHGYTGSPENFFDLGEYLHKKFDATIKIPVLKKHDTKIEDLDNLNFIDFVEDIEDTLKKDLSSKKKVVLVGYSFGAQIALYLASKYPVESVIAVSIPYKLKFPLNLSFIELLGRFKKYWPKKKIDEYELNLLKKVGITDYRQAHINAIGTVNQANKDLEKKLNKINAPYLNIQMKNDYVASNKSFSLIESKLNSKIKSNVFLFSNTHNPFYSKERFHLQKTIYSFLKMHRVFEPLRKNTKASAVVPCYNESPRILNVLETLVKTKLLSEIIIVDDGSNDGTEKAVNHFSKKHIGVKYFKNHRNMGKSYSMERGVKESSNETVFFCDADLVGLTPKIVEQIILPVLNCEFDMFISTRENFMQQAIKKFSLHSGERALKKEIWLNLPGFYKHRFRIEEGLNKYSSALGYMIGFKIFNYTQTLKEKKRGFFKGLKSRILMLYDIFIADLHFNSDTNLHLYNKYKSYS